MATNENKTALRNVLSCFRKREVKGHVAEW